MALLHIGVQQSAPVSGDDRIVSAVSCFVEQQVDAPPSQTEQMLRHLISNALKVDIAGGHLPVALPDQHKGAAAQAAFIQPRLRQVGRGADHTVDPPVKHHAQQPVLLLGAAMGAA